MQFLYYVLIHNNNGDSSNPVIPNRQQNNYHDDNGVIYLITGTAGRSHYEINQQAPFVAKQDDKHFGFLNIDINGKTLKGIFYANEIQFPPYQYVNYYQNNVIDEFTITKTIESDDDKGLNL